MSPRTRAVAPSITESLCVLCHRVEKLNRRRYIRFVCSPLNVGVVSRQFHKAEGDQRRQTASLRNFRAEEIAGDDLLPVSLQELSTSSSALVPAMAQCHAFSECSAPYCVPDRGRGWPVLLVSDDSPTSDSPQRCGPPTQRFPYQLEVGPDFDEPCPPGFRQSKFGATSTEFPAR